MDEDKLRWLAAVIIVLIGIAYMGWLVITYMEQRETGISIRNTLSEWLANNPATAPVVDAEVVSEP
jgi:hypothetical protein